MDRQSTREAVAPIGARIRELRQSRHLLLKDLAARCGLTSSLLSQVERGLASPSLNTLRAVADSLNVPMVTFFEEPVRREDYVLHAADRPSLSLPGQNVAYHILSPRRSRRMQVGDLRLGPGECTANKPHAHDADEVAVVLGGTVDVEHHDSVTRLTTGDSIFLPEGVRHRWINPGKLTAHVLFAISPPAF